VFARTPKIDPKFNSGFVRWAMQNRRVVRGVFFRYIDAALAIRYPHLRPPPTRRTVHAATSTAPPSPRQD
jgi:hypothetical protein